MKQMAFFIIPFLVLLFIGLLWLSYRISKPRIKEKRKPKPQPIEEPPVEPTQTESDTPKPESKPGLTKIEKNNNQA